MLSSITVKNLRSIGTKQRINISPLTVLYGPNGSGKSTIMNAFAIFKNIVLNPNQPVDNFFNLGFAAFGGFEQIVFRHNPDNRIDLAIGLTEASAQVTYGLSLGKSDGRFELKISDSLNLEMELETAFPYPATQQHTETIDYKGINSTINWNGILSQISVEADVPNASSVSNELATLLNKPVDTLSKSDFVHLKRGFSKPHYGTVSLTPTIFTEDEVATLLANDRYLESQVSHYVEQVLDRDLRVRPTPGTNLFWINSTDRTTGLSAELVNDGFGVNQVIYLLAKSLRRDVTFVAIEEPEIHLHPRALRNLAQVLIKLAKIEDKTIMLSTHSEHLILAFLAAISKGNLKSDELSLYFCSKKGRKGSNFEAQSINDKGQVEGGLMSFMEGELEDLKDILSISKRKGG